jgi:hypothetical protein
MKKDLRKIGEGENLNKNLKRIIRLHEEEHMAEEEIKEYMRQCSIKDKEIKNEEG